MKKSLADRIEQYIKVLIARSEDKQIEIQRAELAETFACVPSQVSYVVSTRFTEEEGYYTESRRGGRGYVRITQFSTSPVQQAIVFDYIDELRKRELITERETELIKYLLFQAVKDLSLEYKLKVYENVMAALRQMYTK